MLVGVLLFMIRPTAVFAFSNELEEPVFSINLDCNQIDSLLHSVENNSAKETALISLFAANNYAAKLYERVNELDCEILPAVCNLIGMVYYDRNVLDSARIYLLEGQAYLQNTLRSPELLAENQKLLGQTYQLQGNASMADYYFGIGEDICRKFQLDNQLIGISLNRALSNISSSNLNKAREILNKTIEKCKNTDRAKIQLGYAYQNLARTYIDTSTNEVDADRALKYTKLADAAWSDLNYSKGIYFLNLNYANIYRLKGQPVKQLEYLNKGLNFVEHEDGSFGHFIYQTIGNYYMDQGDDDLAILYYQKALALSTTIEEVGLISIVNNLLSIYEKRKDVDGIKKLNREVVQKYEAQSDKFLVEADKWERKELNLRNQLNEIKALKLENLNVQLKIRQTNLFLLILVLLFTIAGIYGYMRYKASVRNRLLIEQISDQKQKLEVLLKEMHHRVKNNLQTISSLLYLQMSTIEDKNTKELIQVSQSRVEAIAEIHKSLYVSDELDSVEMKSFILNISESLQKTYVLGNVDFNYDMDEIRVVLDKAIPLGLMINEIIINSLKYAFPNGSPGIINIILKRLEDDKLQLIIKDNGIGKNEDATDSFGSQLISLLIDQIDGQLFTRNNDGYEVEIIV